MADSFTVPGHAGRQRRVWQVKRFCSSTQVVLHATPWVMSMSSPDGNRSSADDAVRHGLRHTPETQERRDSAGKSCAGCHRNQTTAPAQHGGWNSQSGVLVETASNPSKSSDRKETVKRLAADQIHVTTSQNLTTLHQRTADHRSCRHRNRSHRERDDRWNASSQRQDRVPRSVRSRLGAVSDRSTRPVFVEVIAR